MNNQKTTLHLSIDSDISGRRGAFSDFSIISEKDGVYRIDFLLGDIPEEDGAVRCALVSRVFMSRPALENLRAAIDGHLAESGKLGAEIDES